jgi:hypothetical protein
MGVPSPLHAARIAYSASLGGFFYFFGFWGFYPYGEGSA